MREELDLALGTARDAQRHRDAALETLADRELTIAKFRELTHQLQEQCLQLQQRVQSTESTKTNVRGRGRRSRSREVTIGNRFYIFLCSRLAFQARTNNWRRYWTSRRRSPRPERKPRRWISNCVGWTRRRRETTCATCCPSCRLHFWPAAETTTRY